MCFPCLPVPDTLERPNWAHWDTLLRVAATNAKGETDVPNEVWGPQHRRQMRDLHTLVRRQCAEQLVRRDVVDMNEARRRAGEEHGRREGYGEGRDCLSA